MNTNFAKLSLPLLVATSLFLSACSSNESGAPTEAAAAVSANQPTQTNPPTSAGIRLTKEQVSTSIEQIGVPSYNATDDTMTVQLKITNNGKVPLPSGGANPVSVGVVQMTPNPAGEATRGQEFRAPFAGDLAPSSSTEVTAVVPGAFASGNSVQFELVQEGVAWFGYDFQQPVVVLGPFKRCADDKGLCDADGKAVAAK